ncbi:MAG: LytTR family transcriptional regulator DNA-binding domain-containing protein [Eubacteriaceae bacterium]|jgi:DNA-binding LytR/AlgR family response regulator|nr:LytTR family transcriptional regulator DNA-binding domain-containing protein [Eubacteriaceae bacterium]
MKIIYKQLENLQEIEVEIRYREMDDDVRNVIRHVEQCGQAITGEDCGRVYKIPVVGIYYAESIEKKTFIYTKEAMFRSELRLYQLYGILKSHGFIQVSRSCIVNIDVLESLTTLLNSRLEATLVNGEKIHVSRTYLADIKDAFTSKEEAL